ncbi:MAG: HAMP domain-containing sensor histidine kinase [Pseudomonadota bacterium]
MIWNWFKEKWDSLIFRLLFYFVISLVVIAIIIATSFAHRIKPHFRNEILPNVEQYIEYIIRDIGVPPDLQVARQLSAKLPFELRIEGRSVNWSSSRKLSAINKYRMRRAPPPYQDVFYGHKRYRRTHMSLLLVEKQGYQYLFAVDNNFRHGSEERHWYLFLVLGGILIGLYVLIRRLFQPVEEISRHMERLGAGDLDQTLELRGRGEIARLSGGINKMSAQIKSMLDSKSGLLLAISHELRSPLTRMKVNLELLEDGHEKQQLISDVKEMETLVSAILESERLNQKHAPLNRVAYDISELIQEVIQEHEHHEMIVFDPNSFLLDIDVLRIKLLLKNLLDNACRYADGKSVKVSLQQLPNQLLLKVQDQGAGIEKSELSRLTEAFYRPDFSRQRNTGGYGLGLYLCRLIIEAHGGSILIESELSAGTCVTIEFPLDNS